MPRPKPTPEQIAKQKIRRRRTRAAWRRANPECGRNASRNWRRNNAARVSAYCKQWNDARAEERRIKQRAYRKARPNYNRDYRARRRLREAWLPWAAVCAANRRVVEAIEASA